MKINTEGITQGNNRIDTIGGSKTGQDIQAPAKNNTENPNSTLSKITNSRTQIDAMIISQMAKNLMHKAFQTSSRLRDVAMNAITTGIVKDKDLIDAVSETRTSLNKIQDGFVPIFAESEAKISINNKQNKIDINIPQIDTEIALLEDFDNELNAGSKPDIVKVDNMMESLGKKSEIVNNSINNIKKSLDIEIKEDIDYKALINNTEAQIIDAPDRSLISQGNLNNDAVAGLF